MASRNFPHWIRAYVSHAQHTEAPIIFHVWSAVSAIAGALRRQVWIDEIAYQYYPNFYIILVGPAAITKTTAINRAMDLLRHVEGVHFGPKSSTWQKFIEKMKEAEQDFTVVLPNGKTKGFITSPITVAAGELGTFFKIEDDVMMDVLTDLWESPNPPGGWTHSTLSGGDNSVTAPCINFIGATTPTWLKRHFPEDLIGAGLTSRIIFVFGDEKAQLVPYPSRKIKSEEYEVIERKLIQDLERISRLKGQYILSDEAFAWGEEWYRQIHQSRPTHMASDRYNGYIGRKQVHLHKLAMLLAAAKRDKLIIEADDLKEALVMIELLEPHMKKVFESIGMVDEAQKRQTLIHLVRVHGVLTSQELWSQVSNIMKQKEFTEAINGLVKETIFKVVMKQTASGKAPAVTLSATAKKEIVNALQEKPN